MVISGYTTIVVVGSSIIAGPSIVLPGIKSEPLNIGVDKDLIERYGAVSEEVAESLAKNIAKKNNTDIGIGITGIAGPGGGTEKKPVGLVFVGIFYKNNLYIKRYNLTPDRITNRELTVTLCLNEIRKILRNS